MLPCDWGCLFLDIILVKSRASKRAAAPELNASAWDTLMPTANLVLS